jgi:hypothetical protein
MLHDDQNETAWQRTEFHLNIKIFHMFKDYEESIRWVNSVNFNYTIYWPLHAAVSISSDILGFSNILTLPCNRHSFLADYLKIIFNSQLQKCLFVCFGFYVTSTQYRSYRDVPALLVEEDLRCPSVHYFRHKRVSE